MVETTSPLVDHVIPHVPVRQVVHSVPKRLRPFLHHRSRTASAVLHILLRTLRATLREANQTAPPSASFGAVSFLHRFGSSLKPHYHYHLCLVDGLFEKIEDDTAQDPATNPEARLRFHEATALTHKLLEGLQHTLRKRVLRHFQRHALLEPHEAEDMLSRDNGGGFNLDRSVRIEATDRESLERLIRGHRREALVVLGRPPPSAASTWSAAVPDQILYLLHGPTSPALPPDPEKAPRHPSDTATPRPSR